ncbi:MAG: hypothetical protein U1G07_18450 [Verrucomicrobiota bacterium]
MAFAFSSPIDSREHARLPARAAACPRPGTGTRLRPPRARALVDWLAAALSVALASSSVQAEDAPLQWWKGNLHTHSFWSDGDDFPEMIVDWYNGNGYSFLAISDHNVLQQAERWLSIGTNQTRAAALQKYLTRFGPGWVETRSKNTNQEVRLKPLSEYRSLFDQAGRFLLIASEEISDQYKNIPIHLNATNLRDHIPAQGGDSVREVMQNNVDAVLYQRRNTGQSMIPHLNHPNFHWGVTAEDLARVRGERFFEVYNGHPAVNDPGDATHPSTDRLWDIALALRLSSGEPEPLYAVAVDDAHNYHETGGKFSNAGRGWIMVRARHLTPESLIRALERGDFYASSGVSLLDVTATSEQLALHIAPQVGIRFRTQFIGTRRGFDQQSEPVRNKEGVILPVTHRYSNQVGEILAEVEGLDPTYHFRGNELYVRARVVSSKAKANAVHEDEKECAWTQPVIPAAKD